MGRSHQRYDSCGGNNGMKTIIIRFATELIPLLKFGIAFKLELLFFAVCDADQDLA